MAVSYTTRADATCSVRLMTDRASARYCSPACRQRAYRQRVVAATADELKAWSDQNCDYCTKLLPVTTKSKVGRRLVRRDAVYCSSRCRGVAYRKRKEGEQLRKSAGISLPQRRSS
jgi:hypothetical protein